MKKFLSAIIIGCMIISISSCGAKPSTTSTNNQGQPSNGVAPDTDSSKWPVVSMPVVPTQPITDEVLVEKAINDYLISINAGVKLDVIPIEFGILNTTMTLMLTSKDDPIDIFSYSFFSSLTSVVANDQVIALDAYIKDYPALVEVIGTEYMVLGQLNDTQYALPVVGARGLVDTYLLRKDIAQAIDVSDKDGEKMTLRELTDILKKAKAQYPNLAFMPLTDVPASMLLDNLGDIEATGVLMNRGLDNTTVANFYKTDKFKEYVTLVKEWEEAGLLIDDPLNQELTKSYVKNGVAGGTFDGSFSVQASAETGKTYGYEFVAFQLSDLVATVQSSASAGYCISSVSNNPDAAMKMLSLLYTDSTLMRFIAQGVEGMHYVVDDKGCSWYPQGQNMATLGWGTGAQWYFPNQTLCIPFETDNANYYVDMLASNKECEKSKALGFSFDKSVVYNEATAVSATIAEYFNALAYGQVDIETYLPEFIKELDNAGIDKLNAEKQKQLDAFLEK